MLLVSLLGGRKKNNKIVNLLINHVIEILSLLKEIIDSGYFSSYHFPKNKYSEDFVARDRTKPTIPKVSCIGYGEKSLALNDRSSANVRVAFI